MSEGPFYYGFAWGVSTAYFDGSNLVGTISDPVALLWDAFFVNGELVVLFEAFGWHGTPGHFHASTSFELEVEGCGTYRLEQYHTSCSRPIELGVPMPLDMGSGDLTFLDMCGCGQSVVPNEDMTWGSLKSLYR